MPAEIQYGLGTVYGVNGAIDVYASVTLQSGKGTHKVSIKDVKSATDFDVTTIATNGYIEATLKFVPTAATRALAAGKFVILANIAVVALSGFDIAFFNGNWQYRGDANVEIAFDKSGEFELPIRKYIDSGQNTSLTTIVTG